MALLTADQFSEQLFDLPEGGRWTELQAGEILTLEPPDDLHGTVVLNLSKSLATAMHAADDGSVGYPSFEAGVIVARNPDTVRRPAVSLFDGESLFADADHPVIDAVPLFVAEIAAGPTRRRTVKQRVHEYHGVGVNLVWVIDTADCAIQVCPKGKPSQRRTEQDTVSLESLLPGFRSTVKEVFALPDWWK